MTGETEIMDLPDIEPLATNPRAEDAILTTTDTPVGLKPPSTGLNPSIGLKNPYDISEMSQEEPIEPNTQHHPSNGIMSGLFRSALTTLIAEIQKSENKTHLLDNIITPIVRHMTGYIITYMKDQFYTQFIAFIAAIAILCIFNILIIIILIYSRR
jgi:hypothetical protein